jgi:hypothetical protein
MVMAATSSEKEVDAASKRNAANTCPARDDMREKRQAIGGILMTVTLHF